MLSVNREETGLCVDEAAGFGKRREAAAAVSAHGALIPVGVKIGHPEIISGLSVKCHQPVGADAEVTVTQQNDLVPCQVDLPFPVIHKNEIISGAMVLGEREFHSAKLTKFYPPPMICFRCFFNSLSWEFGDLPISSFHRNPSGLFLLTKKMSNFKI